MIAVKAIINNSTCMIVSRERLTRGTVGKTMEAEFSAEWEGLAITATFEAGDEKRDKIYTGEPIVIPHEVLSTAGVSVLLGFQGAMPDGTIVKRTEKEWLNNVSETLDPAGVQSSEPTPDWTAQVQNIATEAKQVADSVRSDAQAGKFNGSAGDDGGWYTPAITQPDENTMRFAFTPSKEGMPAVPPKDITIPGGGGGSGEAGGYYAPAVDADGNLSWTASKADMPAVDGTNIKGPQGTKGDKGNTGATGQAGADGKSAYAYAVEGGYTGTEAEFAAKLAEEIPEVDATLTQSGQAADAKAVGDAINSLSEEIVTTAASKVAAHNTATDTHTDIRLLIQGLTDRLNALADSDDTTLDQLSEVVAYIKSNRTLIEAITTSKVSVADIVDNLTTNVTNKPLSAAQGVVIKTLIDALSNDKLDAAELTNAVNTALAQAKASGEFDGADGKSAYAYAVEGGYTGTEAEFTAKLASEALIVGITDNNGTLSADKTFFEISNTIFAGIPVYALYDGMILPLILISGSLRFGTIECVNDDMGAMIGTAIIEITQNGEVNNISTIVETLPNPKALTFTGAVTGSYDGSAPLSVNIPTAVTDAHINSLIDAKLGVIENGSY